ncbi:unnamed protein product [Dracunculus medinensis]|uniref:Metalloendopeptidase n=1 Tax=Dracunculus medinensis TaxID=318479 RepID=A0A0N4UCW2_DRAME|nr:unnamed protein product [Dracunculus medinensis]
MNGVTGSNEIFLKRNIIRAKRFIRQSWTYSRIYNQIRDEYGNYIIPYVISGPYGAHQYAVIYGAFQAIARNTCIRFKPRTFETNFIDLQNRYGEGCWSWIGKRGGQSVVKLESSNLQNCVRHQTVMHELFHAIGLSHEHVRADRDQFVRIIYSNIRPDCLYNFEKRNSQTFGFPYDYQSIMHYNKFMCQRTRGAITISAPYHFMNIIGIGNDASPIDYYKVCALYNCHYCMGQRFNLAEVVRAVQARAVRI